MLHDLLNLPADTSFNPFLWSNIITDILVELESYLRKQRKEKASIADNLRIKMLICRFMEWSDKHEGPHPESLLTEDVLRELTLYTLGVRRLTKRMLKIKDFPDS